MEAFSNWEPLPRNYEAEKRERGIRSTDATNSHPLLLFENSSVNERTLKSTVCDPLTNVVANDTFIDPLSAALQTPFGSEAGNARRGSSSASKVEDAGKEAKEAGGLATAWGIKLAAMRRDFSSADSIHVRADFLGEDAEEGGILASMATTPQKFERSRARLEILESKTSAGGLATRGINLSFEEYSGMLERMHKDLKKFWNTDQKVKALKVTIQAAKMLGDTSVPKIYPALFVMVSNILDEFANLVFERIKEKAEKPTATDPYAYSARLPENFSCRQIPEEAKETCRNWFFKVSCIRELLPRMLIEIALLRCTRFLSDGVIPSTLTRLSHTARGVGDPLVALYVRCYLAHVGVTAVSAVNYGLAAASQSRGYLTESFHDYLVSLQDFRMNKLTDVLSKTKMSETEYFRLHAPAVDWILKCIGKNANEEEFETVLEDYQKLCDSSSVLMYILESFSSNFFQERALDVITLIKNARPTHISIVHMFKVLGDRFATHPPPKSIRLLVLNEVWKVCTHCKDLSLYISCASSWLEVIANHYQGREVMILLQDVVDHVEKARDGTAGATRELEQFVLAVVRYCHHLGAALLTSDCLTKILDTFKLGKKAEICKDVLENFIQVQQQATTDPILIHTIFDIARTLHDSIDDLSPEGDQRHISGLICSFIDRIDFRRDLEQQLNIYVECRAAFPNLDQVKCRLVMATAGLAMKAHRFVKGKHSKKTAAFVKACLAYCHITIPSIDSIFKRLHLLQLCGHVALVNHCLPQADSFFKAAISLIAEVPPVLEDVHKRMSTEGALASYVQGFLGGLVTVPGHPEHGPFYLVTGLLNALGRYQWQKTTGLQTTVYLSVLKLLCAYSQKKLPYSIKGVDSNDLLYARNEQYMEDLRKKMSTVVQAIIGQLTELGEASDSAGKSRQAHLVLDFLNEILGAIYLNDETTKFTVKLLELAKKINTTSSGVHLKKTVQRIEHFNKDNSSFGQNMKAIAALKRVC